jgi:hypothetical protein
MFLVDEVVAECQNASEALVMMTFDELLSDVGHEELELVNALRDNEWAVVKDVRVYPFTPTDENYRVRVPVFGLLQ